MQKHLQNDIFTILHYNITILQYYIYNNIFGLPFYHRISTDDNPQYYKCSLQWLILIVMLISYCKIRDGSQPGSCKTKLKVMTCLEIQNEVRSVYTD